MLAFVVLGFIGFSCISATDQEKFNGVNFVSTSTVQKNAECFSPLSSINANSVAIVPFCFGDTKTGEITIEPKWQWWGETQEGVKTLVKHAQSKELRVMIKPQIWFNHGTFTGDVSFQNEEQWANFLSAYKRYFLAYAKICEDLEVDLFCIGTELGEIVKNKPEFWTNLISEIKEIYSGKLTYAANWDNYTNIPFWNELDYIGIDAYFPVSMEKTPSVEEVKKGWNTHIPEINALCNTVDKPFIFTEFGYRSMDFSGKEPWDSSKRTEVNLEAQKNCFEGTFSSVWQEELMAGGFIWKWYPDNSSGGDLDNRFTPQNKPCLEVISKHYGE